MIPQAEGVFPLKKIMDYSKRKQIDELEGETIFRLGRFLCKIIIFRTMANIIIKFTMEL